MKLRKPVRVFASGLGVLGLVAVGVVVGGEPAVAASPNGQLRIPATGTVYAGLDAIVGFPTARGGIATYSLEVFNKGTGLAQFNVVLAPPEGTTVTLTSGSLLTTPLAASDDGYFTKPIGPGKAEVLTLKVKTPANAGKHDSYFGLVELFTTNHDFLNLVEFVNTVKAVAGTSTNDIVTTTAGSASVVAEPGIFASAITSSQVVKAGGVAT